MVRVIERQDRGKNCPAAIFTPRQPDVSLGPLGTGCLYGGAPKERRRRRAQNWSSKRVFWRVRLFSSHLRFSDVSRANLNGAEKKRTLQKHPVGRPFPRTTPSPLLWRAMLISRSSPNRASSCLHESQVALNSGPKP